jgi:hypothetical protein
MIILRHPQGEPLAKFWRATDEGAQKDKERSSRALKTRYLEATREVFWEGGVGYLFNLIDLLEELQEQRDACLVAGSLTQEARAKAQRRAQARSQGKAHRGGLVYRASYHTQSKGDVLDTPERLIPIDLDSVKMRQGQSVEEAIEEVINERLAPCFRGVSYVYQLSGSMGFKEELSAKLFFISAQDVTQTHLKALHSRLAFVDHQKLSAEGWSKSQQRALVDGALYSRAQMIFTSRPHLEGLADPYPQRTGLIRKEHHLVTLPEVTQEDHTRERRALKPLPQSSLIVEDKGAEVALQSATQRLASLVDERYKQTFSTALYLGRFWTAQRLSRERIEYAILDAAMMNGSIAKHGRDAIEKQIRGGLNEALTAAPLEDRSPFSPLNMISYEGSTRINREPLASPNPDQTALIHTRDYQPSTADEISSEVERVIDLAVSQDLKAVSVVSVPVGAGKTHQGLKRAAREALKGRSVIYLCASYELIKEAEEELQKVAPQVQPQRLEGRLRGCRLYTESPQHREEINQVICEGVDIPEMCKGLACPFWRSCELRKEGRKRQAISLEGALTLTPHSMLPHLDKYLEDMEEEPLIIIDESPQLTYSSESSLSDMSALYPTAEELQRSPQGYDETWRQEHPHTSAFASCLEPLLTSWAQPLQRSMTSPYAQNISPQDLADKLREIEGLKVLALAAIEEDAQPPSIKETDARDSRAEAILRQQAGLVKASALRALKSLARLITGEALSVVLAYDRGSAWIETSAALKLPKRGKIVVLDATFNPLRWALLAQAGGRELLSVEADMEKLKPHLAQGVWIETTSFTRQRLINKGEITPRGKASIETLTRLLEDNHLLKGKIAIGTHKPIAEALERAKQGEGSLQDLKLLSWAVQGGLEVGYTGRDHRGSNAFTDCSTLIILGDPAPNKRSERRVLETLMISATGQLTPPTSEEIANDYQHEVIANLVQWIGRLRHMWRGGCTFISAGRFMPPLVSGVSWTRLTPPRGKPPAQSREHIKAMSLQALERGEAVTQKSLVGLGASQKVARSIREELEREPEIEKIRDGAQGAVMLKKKSVALNGYLYKKREIERGGEVRDEGESLSVCNIKETIKGNPSGAEEITDTKTSALPSPSQITQPKTPESTKTSAELSPTSQITQFERAKIEEGRDNTQGAAILREKSVALNGYLYKKRKIERGGDAKGELEPLSDYNIKETIKGKVSECSPAPQTRGSTKTSAELSPTSQIKQPSKPQRSPHPQQLSRDEGACFMEILLSQYSERTHLVQEEAYL